MLFLVLAAAASVPAPQALPGPREAIDIQVPGSPRSVSVDGDVRSVVRGAAGGWRVVVKPADLAPVTFTLRLPKDIAPPFQVGQRIRMDWSSVQTGFSTWATHATITDGEGRTLLFVNEPPPGWMFVASDLAGASPDYPWATLRRTRIRAPDGWETSLLGWARWTGTADTFLISAFAEGIYDGAEVPPDWSPISSFAGVRE